MSKYDIEVQLTGKDGNAYAIMGAVKGALTRHMKDELEFTAEKIKAETDKYIEESTSGDYNHLLAVAMDWVNVL